jgi:hypothetical protein
VLDAAFAAWLPHRRAQVHRTHGEVIATRAERDRAGPRPCPSGRTWSASGTPAGSARMPWSRLRPATTRCGAPTPRRWVARRPGGPRWPSLTPWGAEPAGGQRPGSGPRPELAGPAGA